MSDSDATTEFLVPDLGEGLEDVTIVQWLAQPGQRVELNQPLCLVETAKAEVEIPSPHAGVVVSVNGAPGDTLPVGAVLATFSVEPTADRSRQPTLVGYGFDDALDRTRRRPRAKPPVRKLARELGVDLSTVAPSGAGDVVTRDDVRGAAAPAPARTTRDEVIPVKGVRARIAEQMSLSRQRIPDATCSVVTDCTRLLDVRASLNAAVERRGLAPLVTPFALMARFVVSALTAQPILNATFSESANEIRVSSAIHLGIGTATDRGLVVAVVRDAGERSTLDLALELERLAAAARAGTLAPSAMVGSTFTISNFGALGLDDGVPVINHPEAAILGIGRIAPRPHVVDDELCVRSTSTLTLAFDHRVCDGADSARFLTTLRALIEAPELALLDS